LRHIVDADTHEALPVGTTGELIIKGPQIMQGYWQKPLENAEVLHDGWLYTGDLAVMDEKGYFSIVGRKKNLIITSGLNVYPVEVETVLRDIDEIEDAAVIGLADKRKGEVVKAFVVLKKHCSIEEKALKEICRDKLAGFKCPAAYEFIDEIPRTIIGKVLYRELRRIEAEQSK